MYVDPGYELERVHPKEKLFLEHLRTKFAPRANEPIPFYDLKAAMYKIGDDMYDPVSDFNITHILRNLWRAGYLRRFIVGKTNRSKKVGRGEWYGVHYILYPKNGE